MNRLQRFLWKNLGITLSPTTYILAGLILLTVVSAILLSFVPQDTFLHFLLILFLIPGIVIGCGGSYHALNWSLSNQEECAQIEQEIALGQLKKRVQERKRHLAQEEGQPPLSR
jgi:hypothetical protein